MVYTCIYSIYKFSDGLHIKTETEIFQMYSCNGEKPWSSLYTKYYHTYVISGVCALYTCHTCIYKQQLHGYNESFTQPATKMMLTLLRFGCTPDTRREETASFPCLIALTRTRPCREQCIRHAFHITWLQAYIHCYTHCKSISIPEWRFH